MVGGDDMIRNMIVNFLFRIANIGTLFLLFHRKKRRLNSFSPNANMSTRTHNEKETLYYDSYENIYAMQERDNMTIALWWFISFNGFAIKLHP